MKILVIHNILWAHYKSVLFEGMAREASPNTEFHVVQIAKNELSRKSMNYTYPNYNYPFTVLFDDFIENIPIWRKTLALFKFILKYNPDVINVTGYAVDISISLSCFFGKMLGKTIVISNESVSLNNSNNKLTEYFKKKIISTASGFICFGTLAKEYMIKLGAKPAQILEDKAAVIDDIAIKKQYDNASIETLKKYNIITEHNFIFVGRFIKEKNLESLLNTFNRFNKGDGKDWGLILLGDGILKNNLKQQVENEKINNVYFLPAVSWDYVSPHFKLAKVLILPSKFEPWGLVVNEAMTCGLPIIISKNCGCWPDLIDKNGFAIETEKELGNAMHEMLNFNLRTTMGERSKEIIKNFEVASVSKRIIKKLESL